MTVNNDRFQCARSGCKWTGLRSEFASIRFSNFVSHVCPRCECEDFHSIPAPITNDRVDHANQLIKIISEHGRKFFAYNNKVSSLEIDKRGRVWFVDKYTRRRIYTHYKGRWAGFSEGGTLRNLVCAMREYIMTGTKLDIAYLSSGRWGDGDVWGYGAEAVAAMRAEAVKLPIIKQSEI